MAKIYWNLDTAKLFFGCSEENLAGGRIAQKTKQTEQILNFQVPAEGLKLVILLYTQY